MFDFKKLYGIFVEEALERVAELEDGLLGLEKSSGDMELLDTIFRAAHTIKGSSGTIGLKDISVFTHNLEEVLDMVRQGQLVPGRKLIDTLLAATDMIKEMITAVAAETVFDFGRCGDLIKEMQDLKTGTSGPLSQSLSVQPVIAGNDEQFPPQDFVSTSSRNDRLTDKYFRIIFVPASNLLTRGIDPSIVIEDLKAIGEIASIKANTDAVPLLSEINPEDLYLRWDILLKTDCDAEEIRRAFEFVEEGSEIKIFPVSSPGKDMPYLGQMLVEQGAVRTEDVHEALKNQKRLGEILIDQGKAAVRDIEKAVEKQAHKKTESFSNSVTSTIRVDLGKLDHLINIVGEMVIIHSMFQQILTNPDEMQEMGSGLTGRSQYGSDRLDGIFSQLQRIGKDIQESAMSLRMLPVGDVFHRFSRLVRELSQSRDKTIELTITGEDTELDKGVLEKITDPLVHLIRNSIDHGIEGPEERTAKGKPAYGTLHLGAYQMGDSVYIEIEDDGRGLNREKIIEKAVSKGIINSASGLEDEQVYNLIFLPGFSTADKITDVSGRGVGMDVVKKNIESLNGKVHIRTKQDSGTTISIKLPLTLAIIEGLTVSVGQDVYIVPITSVQESLRPGRNDVRTLNEKGEVINVRGEYIPLLRLHDVLGTEPLKKDPWEAIVVVTQYEGKKYGLLVDNLMGQQQVVIKNLGSSLPRVSDISGGTILGNGKVALVLDVPGVIETATSNTLALTA